MSTENQEKEIEKALAADSPSLPSTTELLEFARRTKALNLEVPLGTLLENGSIVERRARDICVFYYTRFLYITQGGSSGLAVENVCSLASF